MRVLEIKKVGLLEGGTGSRLQRMEKRTCGNGSLRVTVLGMYGASLRDQKELFG